MPRLRAFRAGDEGGIRRLFETCHQRALPEALWRWRYAPGPSGAPVAEVAEEQGEIVGHVAALRVPLRRAGAEVSAGMWVDLMVAPRHRNLELFLDMAESNRRRCAEQGVELLFAFPNDRSFPVLKRMLGWNHLAEIKALEAPFSNVKRPDPPAGWRVDPIRRFDNDHTELWDRLRPNALYCAARSAARLNWRYIDRPEARYQVWAAFHDSEGGRLAGWAAAKVFEAPEGRYGDILDLWAEPGEATRALLAKALGWFEASAVTIVSAWALPGDPRRAALEALGLSEAGGALTHFAGRWTAESRTDFPDGKQWSVSKGDSDVF